jgi:MFS family permease
MRNDKSSEGNKLILKKPDPYIVYLGIIVFFAAICEGGMFDWSGVFFKEVVNAEIFTWGYFLFMICMASSRFISDFIIDVIGMPRLYIVSAALVCTGILIAVAFPYFWPSVVGFCLVGMGTASVIPMTFTLAGNSKKYSPGMAISIIATYSIAGMLLGPPIIGYLAHAVGLRISFVVFAFAGLMLIPISQLFFRHMKSVS